MKKLKKYVGRVVTLRPELFARLMAYARLQGATLDNRFLVAAGGEKKGMLVCYGGRFRFLVSSTDVLVV